MIHRVYYSTHREFYFEMSKIGWNLFDFISKFDSYNLKSSVCTSYDIIRKMLNLHKTLISDYALLECYVFV